MTSDVVLSAALRSNLLSLQNTQKSIDSTQLHLSTGKKVNSALDNPQSFFASQSLTNRANDLTKLLDNLGQSIQVINAANNGVTALTTLINQAQSLANTAQSTIAGASTQATVTGSVSLGTGKLTNITGILATSELQFTVTDPAGGTSPISAVAVTFSANDTALDLVTKINDLNTSLSTPAISASLDSSNRLVLTAVNGGNLNVKFGDTGQNNFAPTTAPNDQVIQAFASALGFNAIAQLNLQGTTATAGAVDFTATASANITSKALYTSVGTIATASTLLSALKDSTGTALTAFTGTTDTLNITVGGKTTAASLLGASTATASIQSVVDAINNDANVKTLVSASFDTTTGKINLVAKDASATDVKITFATSGTGGAGDKLNLGFDGGINTLTPGAASAQSNVVVRFGAAAGTLASLQTQYNTVRTQIDALVTNGDTGYAGTNLLNGNNLITYFNEGRTSSLTSTGVTFNSSGLGIAAANFQSSTSINTSITQTNAALSTVRNFGSTLATNLSIIQARQDFTNNLIDTLNSGASALTDADQNEEGAKLLALQTRQSLGITALSLASQSQQSILRLFG